MRAKSIAALTTLLLSSCAAYRTHTLAAASTVMLGIDWVQTVDITRNCTEWNPIIGPCGERISPHAYFPIVMALNLLAGYALAATQGDNIGQAWFGGVTGLEGVVVWGNAE